MRYMKIRKGIIHSKRNKSLFNAAKITPAMAKTGSILKIIY
jgi:hypothetical protein